MHCLDLAERAETELPWTMTISRDSAFHDSWKYVPRTAACSLLLSSLIFGIRKYD